MLLNQIKWKLNNEINSQAVALITTRHSRGSESMTLVLGQKKKEELVLRPRRMYFLPPAFNFFPPQNVKKNLKQVSHKSEFSCLFQFWALLCTSSKCLCILICISVTGKHSYNIDKEMVWPEGDRKEGKTDDVLSFVVSDICWGNNHPPMECSGGGGGGVTVQGPLLAIFTLLYAMEALEQAGNYLPSTKTSLSKRQSEGQKRILLWQCHVVC